MKNLLKGLLVCFVLILLTGCGSTKPLKIPPYSEGINSVDPISAPKSNVKVVVVQKNRSLFGNTEKRALVQMQELLEDSNHFGLVTTDPNAAYEQISDVPLPQNGDLILGVTIEEKEYVASPAAHLGKFFLNMATLSISSTIIPFNMDHFSRVTLTPIDQNGPMDPYVAEAITRRFWSSWSIGQMKTLIGARVAVHKQAMFSAVNQLVTGTSVQPSTL